MKTIDFTLRKALESDKERIEELFTEMLKSIYGVEAPGGYESGYLDRFLSGGDDCIYVAESGGAVMGYISVEVHDEEEKFLYLDDLSVSERFRGCGIGSALIKRAEAYAAEINAEYTALHAESSNSPAIRLYERLGYKKYRNDGKRIFMRRDTAEKYKAE